MFEFEADDMDRDFYGINAAEESAIDDAYERNRHRDDYTGDFFEDFEEEDFE